MYRTLQSVIAISALVAMGILANAGFFEAGIVLGFIAAAIGWYLWYRDFKRKGGDK